MKKGFTLIELLAVIVILAIIAVIAVPIVLNIINETKESATLRSADMYLGAAEMAIANRVMHHGAIDDGVYSIMSDGDICLGGYNTEGETKTCAGKPIDSNNDKVLKVEVKGEKPTSGQIVIKDGQIFKELDDENPDKITKLEIGGIPIQPIKGEDGKVNFGIVDSKKEKEESMVTLADTIINHSKEKEYYYETKPTFSDETKKDEYGLYKDIDDLGDTYYFRGDVDNNYVEFGQWQENSELAYMAVGPREVYSTLEACQNEWTQYDVSCEKISHSKGDPMYWRIVRINGDGTIRLIYDGLKLVENGSFGKVSSNIGTSKFNNQANDIKYAGYTYDDGTGKQVNSAIKTVIDTWYTKNLESKYSKYIADEIFCNDKKINNVSYQDDNGTPTTEALATNILTSFESYTRISNDSPSLKCSNKNDRYTMNTTNGNGLLSKPVGLLTADEVSMAGVHQMDRNENSYIYSSYSMGWHTMSPRYLHVGGGISTLIIYKSHDSDSMGLDIATVDESSYVRPVINLKADVKFTGSGTVTDPYVIVTE